MKNYVFKQVNENGDVTNCVMSKTLKELSAETNITTSTLHRIKEMKTQGKAKGRFKNCYVELKDV